MRWAPCPQMCEPNKQAMEHTKEKGSNRKSRDASLSREYATAAGTFAAPAWILDVPLETVTVIATFLFVGYVSSVLFNRLAGIRRLSHESPKWIGFVQSVVLGTALGLAGASGHEYFDAVGIGGAALAGLILSLMDTGWRQRWSERQIYREMLLSGQPET